MSLLSSVVNAHGHLYIFVLSFTFAFTVFVFSFAFTLTLLVHRVFPFARIVNCSIAFNVLPVETTAITFSVAFTCDSLAKNNASESLHSFLFLAIAFYPRMHELMQRVAVSLG